jgi:methyltransferase
VGAALAGSAGWFLLLVWAVGLERVADVAVSAANAGWAFARGGVEYGRGHLPAVLAVHAGWLVAAPLEVVAAHRPFLPWLGWPMLALVLAGQGLRWWAAASLGRLWNIRVIVVPGAALVRTGPYRWLRHPDYLGVAVSGVALPLVHTAWLTAIGFAVAFGLLLRTRIRVEDAALAVLRR